MSLKKAEFEGLVDVRAAFTSSYWPVAERYRVAGRWITPVEEEGGRFSFPLTDPGLFLSFARLGARGEPSVNGIVGWVEKHGVLLEERVDPGNARHASMRVATFRTEIHRAYWLLSLYTDIRVQDVAAIAARCSDPKSSFDERLRGAFEDPVEEGGTGVTTDSETHRVLWLAYAVLTATLQESLGEVRLSTAVPPPEEFDPEAPRFDPGWRCPNLLSALYLQFYLLVTANTPLRRCENPKCRLPFPLTRKNKRFCDASCRSNARHYR